MSGRGRGKRVPKNEVVEEKPAKKTGRKKEFPVVAIITPEGIEGNLLPETRKPLIVHLPIQTKDIVQTDMPIVYDPHPPAEAEPYDSNADNPFYEGVQELDVSVTTFTKPTTENQEVEEKTTQEKALVSEPQIDYYNIKSTLLVQFKDSSEISTIPMSSDAACFWDCHNFSTRPVVLPIRDTGKHLEVMGNFCSPECACAYLFKMPQDSHTRWEQLSLLYRVYGEACGGKIHPAPPVMILNHFGGNLSIAQYRNMLRSQKVRADVHLPPMVSILATMDTKPIDFYDASLTKGLVETVKDRIQKAEEVLRLRRTKPLKAWESTLDACMNLKIKS
jgi:hypothetical protein